MTSRSSVRMAWTLFGAAATCLTINVVLAVLNTTGPQPVSAGMAIAACAFYLVMFTFAAVGLLIALRRPGNAIGWLMLAIGITWELPSEELVRYGIVTAPGSVPMADIIAVLSGPLWVPGIGLIGTFLLLLFPDGHLPSHRWRPVAWGSASSLLVVTIVITLAPGSLRDASALDFLSATTSNPLGIAALAPFETAVQLLVLLVPISIVACAASMIVRFRRARGRERHQLKWLAVSAVVCALVYLAVMVLTVLFDADSEWGGGAADGWLAVLQSSVVFVFALIPGVVGIAILRHRLYDIDVIINRALVYGLLTTTLAAIYITGVLGVGAVVRAVSGQEPGSLTVAVSTLVVAGLFTPLRVRIQAAIDRRFYRRRYNAQHALATFAVRVRDQVDLPSLRREVVATVGSTVQPASVFLWIRPPAPGRE